jgi:hypothetical protein
MRSSSFAILAAGLLFGADAKAGQFAFESPKPDEWVVLTGTIETRPIDLSTTVHVRLTGPAGKTATIAAWGEKLNGVPADVNNAKANSPLPIPPITLSSEEKTIPVDATADIVIALKGLTRPGVYSGPVELALVSEPATAVRFRVKVVIGVKPTIEIPDKNLAMSVSDCASTCWFTEWISPGTTTRTSTLLTVINHSPVDLALSATAKLQGSSLYKQITLTPQQPVTIAPGQAGYVPIEIDRNQLLPDHYVAAAIVTATASQLPTGAAVDASGGLTVDNTSVTSVPLTVDVRAGAVIPFIVVLMGVLAGRLSKFLGDPNRAARVALYAQYIHLKDRIQQLSAPLAQRHCQTRLDVIWGQVMSGNPTEDRLRQDLLNLANEIDLFGRLQDLRDEIQATIQISAGDRTLISTELDKAAQALIADDLKNAATSLTAAQTAIESAIGQVQTPAPADLAHFATVRNALGKVDVAVKTQHKLKVLANSKLRMGVLHILKIISGVDTTEAVAFQFRVLRPLFFVTLVFVVALYGLWLQYSGVEHSTFGSKGFTEYVGLFLWGFGAQVVAMNFQDIQFAKK